jgi:hypothetical protein
MAVMKKKVRRLERIGHLDVPAQLSVVVPSDDDDFATRPEAAQQLSRFPARGFIVNQIAEDDQLPRRVFIYQFRKPLHDRRHSPERNKAAGGALAQFVSEMEIRYRQPTFGFVEER